MCSIMKKKNVAKKPKNNKNDEELRELQRLQHANDMLRKEQEHLKQENRMLLESVKDELTQIEQLKMGKPPPSSTKQSGSGTAADDDNEDTSEYKEDHHRSSSPKDPGGS